MKVYIRPRQTGKTTEMIRVAHELDVCIVCPTFDDAKRIWDMAKAMNVKIQFPVTWSEFILGRYHGRDIKGFVIDDVDRCVQHTTGVPVLAVSINGNTNLGNALKSLGEQLKRIEELPEC